jgi:hypothetical protein
VMGTKKQYQETSVGLDEKDRGRLLDLARLQGRTKTEVARDAIRWYLDNWEKLEHDKRETEVAQAMRYATEQHLRAINSGVDRICKMLARQGIAIGTLYELSWMSLPDDDNARAAFEQAIQSAKQKMNRHVEKDEQELAEKMKRVGKSQ